MVPKPYERVATSGTGQGLIEPLLVRAYLDAGQSLPRGQPRWRTYAGGRTELFASGVLQQRGQGRRRLAVPQPDADLRHRPAPTIDLAPS